MCIFNAHMYSKHKFILCVTCKQIFFLQKYFLYKSVFHLYSFLDTRQCSVCGHFFLPNASHSEIVHHTMKCKGPRNINLPARESPMVTQVGDGKRRQSAMK